MAKKIYEACRRLLTTCANCQPNENILIVTDTDSLEIGMALWDAAEEFPKKTMVMMEPRKMHGEEPTPLVAAAMLKADVIFRATKFSLSHSHARRDAFSFIILFIVLFVKPTGLLNKKIENKL